MFSTKYQTSASSLAHDIQSKFAKVPGGGHYRSKDGTTLFMSRISKTEILAKMGVESAKEKRAMQRMNAVGKLCSVIDTTYGDGTAKRLKLHELQAARSDDYNGIIDKANGEIVRGLIEAQGGLGLDANEKVMVEQHVTAMLARKGFQAGTTAKDIKDDASKYLGKLTLLVKTVHDQAQGFGIPPEKVSAALSLALDWAEKREMNSGTVPSLFADVAQMAMSGFVRPGLIEKALDRHFPSGADRAVARQHAQKAVEKFGTFVGPGQMEEAANKAMDEYASRPAVLDRVVDDVYRDLGGNLKQGADAAKTAMLEAIKQRDSAAAEAATGVDPRTSSLSERKEAASLALLKLRLGSDASSRPLRGPRR